MKLACDDVGSGPVVVLLHGFPLDRTLWTPLVDALRSTHRLIVPDLRGHGRSGLPEDGTSSIDGMAHDVLETLNALDIREPVVVGGLSMGGYVALSLALHHPDRLSALMLFDTRSDPDTPEIAQRREVLAEAVEGAGSIEPVIAAMLPQLFSPITRAQHPDRIERIREVMAAQTPRHVAATLRGLAVRPGRTEELPSLAVPTLFLFGRDDEITPPSVGRAMAKRVAGSTFVEVPDAGHLAPIENPEAVRSAVHHFLNSLPD